MGAADKWPLYQIVTTDCVMENSRVLTNVYNNYRGVNNKSKMSPFGVHTAAALVVVGSVRMS